MVSWLQRRGRGIVVSLSISLFLGYVGFLAIEERERELSFSFLSPSSLGMGTESGFLATEESERGLSFPFLSPSFLGPGGSHKVLDERVHVFGILDWEDHQISSKFLVDLL